jgi:hypothetical protein
MGLNDLRSITENDRQRIIIEFIRSKPYCSAQDVVEGVENKVSRVTVFKTLHKLIESGAVQNHLENKQKRNSREYKLYVDEGNPLVSVPLELDKFESAYFDLFYKEMNEFEQRLQAADEEFFDSFDKKMDEIEPGLQAVEKAKEIGKTMYDKATKEIIFLHAMSVKCMLDVFYAMVDACLFRFLFIWSQKIPDRQLLQKLYSIVFWKIADMQTRISESFKSSPMRNANDMNMTLLLIDRFRGASHRGPLEKYLDRFKGLGKEKEIEPVIDALWKIFGELQPNVYPEPRSHH